MIDEIQVQNLALIRDAVLEPACGLTVLTGETGAGKTALLSALKLLMGERADKSLVRDGTESLQVSGRFFLRCRPAADDAADDAAAGDAEAERDVSPESDDAADASEETELVAQRRVRADGRSRVSIDGSMASVKDLARQVAPSIDLCGQHEHQRLLNPATHAELLDAWAGPAAQDALASYREALAAAQAAEKELARIRDAAASSSAQLDDARFTLRRIDDVSPEAGEYESLAADLEKAEHAESLARAANGAHAALSDEGGAIDSLASAIAALDGGARYDSELAPLAQSLREAGYVLEDVAREALDYRDAIDFDAETLAAQQERMAALQGLLRTYGPRMEDVLAAREQAADLVSMVDEGAEREKAAQAAVERAEAALAKAAAALDEARREAAPRFGQAVTSHMDRLEMGGAELVCDVAPLPRASWTRAGSSAVEFLFRPGASMQARPLARIASGGEVSRVMLAVKVALGSVDAVDTLVFDEVDAGVGGSVANALADVLADLATTHQVIVVTHLAQVAVRGRSHYLVRKESGADSAPETHLIPLAAEDRPAEIARMLSGDITETSLTHARELLAQHA